MKNAEKNFLDFFEHVSGKDARFALNIAVHQRQVGFMTSDELRAEIAKLESAIKIPELESADPYWS